MMLSEENTGKKDDKLVVVWSSADPDVAMSMTFMYTHAAKRNRWFEDVTLVIWGPSARLITENEALQQKIKSMQDDGVVVEACITCARMFGVEEKLSHMGFDVKSMGLPLSEYLKKDARVLTF
jgi:hypothetical protein